MPNRRQLLIAGAALPGMWLVAGLAVARSSGVPPTALRTASAPTLRRVLIDRRHADSRRFGRALERQGVQAVDFDGDLSMLWRDLLAPAAFGGGGALAGMTTPAALCCLERLASGRGLRVVARVLSSDADAAWRHGAAEADTAPLLRWVIAAR